MLLRTGFSCLGFALLGTAAGAVTALPGAAAAGSVFGNMAGNFGTYFMQHLGRRAAERYFARWPTIEENKVMHPRARRFPAGRDAQGSAGMGKGAQN